MTSNRFTNLRFQLSLLSFRLVVDLIEKYAVKMQFHGSLSSFRMLQFSGCPITCVTRRYDIDDDPRKGKLLKIGKR